MSKLSLELTKLLYMRFASTYGEKFVKNHPTDQFVQLWWEEWSEGMADIDPEHIKEGLNYCRLNLEWPPSIAEFRRICENASGLPSLSDALQSAIRREFNHPIISIAYEKVGNWAMKHDKEYELGAKFKHAYQEALNEFRQKPNECWKLLENFQQKISLPSPPPKIPSSGEIKSFKQHYAEWKEKAAQEKKVHPGHPVYEKNKIDRLHRDFDEHVYQERRKYLISLSERDASTLESGDYYDRNRFLSEIQAHDAIKNNPPRQDSGVKEKRYSRPLNGSNVIYGKWGY